MVEATVSFNPNEIPTQNVDCSNPLENKAEICFTMSRHSEVNTAQAQINYTFMLDATRKTPNNRVYIREKLQEETGSLVLDLKRRQCSSVNFFIEACPEDIHNPLMSEFRFTFDGLPSDTNLKPSLAQQAQTTTFHPLKFQINCGADEKCVDNLKVDFNFTRSSVIAVGIDELLDVTVSVENREENSYNSLIILTYPAGLSYRKFSALQGRIQCSSLDSEDGVTRGKTDCTIDKPIFKSNSKAVFIVSYGIGANSQLDRKIFVTANATSSFNYCNFTFGTNNLQKPVQQSIKDCSVAKCRVFRCSRFMGRKESKTYTISANLSSAWIEQIGLPSAKFLLTSTASLEYDRDQYIFYSTATNNNPPVHKIETEVEVFPVPDFTKEIVGGSLGGLAFLALLTAGLYKAGFLRANTM